MRSNMGASGHQMSRAACRKPPATRLLLWHGATPTTRRRWASGAAYLPLICLCIKARAHAPSTRYIVCATGKTAEEMLGILQERLRNTPDQELTNGAAEQNKITHLRLNKLLAEIGQPSSL